MFLWLSLNGVKSTQIKGLVIQELPPVSKPLMRTEIDEIDGRDGDIITPLGYSAYDKEVLIGLRGDFNVDDVISFFDSSGTVIFSNEPNKYYNYQILAQIDFEKLIRFRQATVTFHVQPFKYSAVEPPLNVDVAEGTPVTLKVFNKTENGINSVAQMNMNRADIIGTGVSGATEFYMPIQPLTLTAGNYTLNFSSIYNYVNPNLVSVRMIQSVPSNADSFGGTYLTFTDNRNNSLTATLTETMTFNYLWFYVSTSGQKVQVLVNPSITEQSIFLNNLGNTKAKPTLTIYGTDTVNLYLNGSQVFVIDLSTYGSITIDTEAMEAYLGNILMNRQVTGNYENFALQQGGNTISWTGNVTQIEVDKYSRWI